MGKEALKFGGFKENPKIKIRKLKEALGKVPGRAYIDNGNIIIYHAELEWNKRLTILKPGSRDIGKKTIPDKGKALIEEIAIESARMGRVPDVIDLIETKRYPDEKKKMKFDHFNDRYAYKKSDVRETLSKNAKDLNPDEYADMTLLAIGRKLDNERVE